MTYKDFVRDTYDLGERAPLYKGFVYYDVNTRAYKVTLIGFNLIFRLIREAFFFIRCAKFEYYEERYNKNQRGYNDAINKHGRNY